MKVLILCTGNSCRSQMAEGYLKSFSSKWEVFSAGTQPSSMVHPNAVKVMKEDGIDLSKQSPTHVNEFIHRSFDYVITVCGDAQENCPYFKGQVKQRLHMGFEDPAKVKGTEEFVLQEFRRIRDEIKTVFHKFYNEKTST
jgi:arsenate reductase